MKILAILFITFFISGFQMFAQEETLMGKGEISNGGFGGPVIKYTQIYDKSAVLLGGRGGWIINHTFVIGGGGYGLVNHINADYIIDGNQALINFGYGGLELEYIILSDQMIHFSVYSLIGAGNVNFSDQSHGDWEDGHNHGNDEFFVLEPAANVELNVISFFRINAGVSYRYISGVNYNVLQNSDLAGFSGVLTLKFGSF